MPENFCTLRAEELKDQFFDRTALFPGFSTVLQEASSDLPDELDAFPFLSEISAVFLQ
ncbi:MAG: hypothetical protein RLZZ232_3153 [Planctomycetota bacterium]|jgi:hypothetical protein